MNHATLIAAASAALVLSGCGSNSATGASDVASPDSLATQGAVPGPEFGRAMSSPIQSEAQGFANAAAGDDRFMIEMSKLADTRARSPATSDFARRMIEEHGASSAKLAAAATASGITPTPRLSAMQQETLERLSAQSGAGFDAAFARAQVDAHRAALQVLEGYAATGSDASLKAFARSMAAHVARHLEMARKLR